MPPVRGFERNAVPGLHDSPLLLGNAKTISPVQDHPVEPKRLHTIPKTPDLVIGHFGFREITPQRIECHQTTLVVGIQRFP